MVSGQEVKASFLMWGKSQAIGDFTIFLTSQMLQT